MTNLLPQSALDQDDKIQTQIKFLLLRLEVTNLDLNKDFITTMALSRGDGPRHSLHASS